MGTAHQCRIARIAQRALEGAADADAIQLRGDERGPSIATATHLAEAFDQRRIGRIEPQADDVQGLIEPRHGNLDARHEAQTKFGRGGRRQEVRRDR